MSSFVTLLSEDGGRCDYLGCVWGIIASEYDTRVTLPSASPSEYDARHASH